MTRQFFLNTCNLYYRFVAYIYEDLKFRKRGGIVLENRDIVNLFISHNENKHKSD